MDVNVNDTRLPREEVNTLITQYPLGAFTLLRDRNVRVTIVGHTDDGQLIVMNGPVKEEVTPSDDVIILGRTTEEYVQRLIMQTRRVAQDNGYLETANPALERLTTETLSVENDVVLVEVTTVGRYALIPRNARRTQTTELLQQALREAYYARHGEFDTGYFTTVGNVDERANVDMGSPASVHSVTIEIVANFPEPTP